MYIMDYDYSLPNLSFFVSPVFIIFLFLVLTSICLKFILFKFILWPTEFHQEYLCDNHFGGFNGT